jgi:aryl-alcohol dehydrogenase-like predicted oxidoreductase
MDGENAAMSSAGRFRLGRSSIEVAPLGVGTWAWGDRWVWGFGRGYAEPEVEAAFHAGRAGGADFFDTAEVYGRGLSERILGRLAAREPEPVFLATKFFPYPWRPYRGALVPALRASLRRLGVPCVDLYQIHWPFPPVPIEAWMNGLADAVELGLTRAVGVSNYSVRQMERAHAALAQRGLPLVSNQVEYSLLDRSAERSGLMQACRDLEVSLIAYSPLGMGLLTGKYGPGRPPPLIRRRRLGGVFTRIGPIVAMLRAIGEEQGGKTPAQVALNWTMSKGTIPIPGAKTGRQAAENCGALGWRLTPDQVARLDEVSARIKP